METGKEETETEERRGRIRAPLDSGNKGQEASPRELRSWWCLRRLKDTPGFGNAIQNRIAKSLLLPNPAINHKAPPAGSKHHPPPHAPTKADWLAGSRAQPLALYLCQSQADPQGQVL